MIALPSSEGGYQAVAGMCIADAIRSGARSRSPKGGERFFLFVQRVLPKLVDNSIIQQLKGLKRVMS